MDTPTRTTTTTTPPPPPETETFNPEPEEPVISNRSSLLISFSSTSSCTSSNGSSGGGSPTTTTTPNPNTDNPKRNKQQRRKRQRQQSRNRRLKNKRLSSLSSSSTTSSSFDSDDDEEEEESNFEREAPDGGWGWVVVGAAFLVNLVADGVTLSFGVFFPHFSSSFGSSKLATSWVGSLLAAMPLLSGPIASSLTDRYGCRKVTVLGGLLASFGCLLSYYADSIYILMLTFGVITGFGLSVCYVAAVVIVAYYFEKRRSFATGLSVCGGGIGTFIFGPVLTKLLDLYKWRTTMLILAGFFLLLCVCGLFMKDLEWTKRSARKKERVEKNEELFARQHHHHHVVEHLLKSSGEASTASQRLCNSAVCIPTFLTRESKENRRKNKRQNQNPTLQLPNAPVDSNQNYHRPSLTYRGAILNLKRTRPTNNTTTSTTLSSSCPDIISTNDESEGKDNKHPRKWKDLLWSFYSWGKGTLDENLKNSRFLLFIVSNFLLYMWYDIPYYFLVDSATELGYTASQGSLLGSTIGLCNVFGNIILGYVGDRKWANSIRVYGVCISVCGIVTAAMPLLFTGFFDEGVNYVLLCVLCGVFGGGIAANYSLTSVILVQIVSLERFANAYGLLLLMQGVGNLIGPPIAGALFDYTQTWSWTFYVAGVGILVSNVFVLAPVFQRKNSHNSNNSNNHDIEKRQSGERGGGGDVNNV